MRNLSFALCALALAVACTTEKKVTSTSPTPQKTQQNGESTEAVAQEVERLRAQQQELTGRIQTLSKELETASDELAKSREGSEELSKKIIDLQKSLAEARAERDGAAAALQEANDKLAARDIQIRSLEETASAQRVELAAIFKGEIRYVDAMLTRSSEHAASLPDSLAAHRTALGELIQTAREATAPLLGRDDLTPEARRDGLNGVAEKVNAALAAFPRASSEESRVALSLLQGMVLGVKARLAVLRADADAGIQALGEISEKITQVRQDFLKVSAKAKTLETERDEARVESEALGKQVTDLTSQNGELARQRDQLAESVKVLELDLEKGRKRVADLEAHLAANPVAEETLRLKEQIQKLTADNTDLFAQVARLTEEKALLQRALDASNQELVQKKAENQLLRDRMAELERLVNASGKDYTKVPVTTYPVAPLATWCTKLREGAFDEVTSKSVVAALKEMGDYPCAQIGSRPSSVWNLSLNNMGLVDLQPVAAFPKLKRLSATGNRLYDLKPLAGLKDLKEIILADNVIDDLKPLAGLKNLRVLVLADNAIASLEGLEDLTNLEELWLTRNRVKDLAPLKGLTGLRRLYVAENQVGDLSPLAGLEKLEVVGLTKNPLSNLDPVTRLASLRLLWAKGFSGQCPQRQGLECRF